MSLYCTPGNTPQNQFRKQAFKNCMEDTKNPFVQGRANKLHHCCELTGCDNPEVVDRRCPRPKKYDEPHFGDIRPEGVKHNSKHIHKGIGVL